MRRIDFQRDRTQHSMKNHARGVWLSVATALVALLAVVSPSPTLAQDVPPPQPMGIDCATGTSIQLLKATPVGDGDQTLVLGRAILEPGGVIGAHKNVGKTSVVVESGSFGFTLLDDEEMVITRAATEDTEARDVPVVVGEEVTLNPGDSYVPPIGAAHIGTNQSDGETTLLFAALVETGVPLEQCIDIATPVS